MHHSAVLYLLTTSREYTIEEELGELTEYYRNNSLRANPDKTQVTAFLLRNREEKRSFKVSWNGVDLENTTHPKYLGVTLDRTWNYKQHMQNTKMKVATRNNLLKKLANSKWGTNASTIRTTALALCYSIAEYAAPVWARSTYADILDPELNKACRAITGCLKPTYVEDLYLLAGIAPPDIRRDVCTRMERTKQIEQVTNSLFGQIPARSRLKSRKDFLTSVKPSYFPGKVVQCNDWQRRSRDKSRFGMVNLNEEPAKGYDNPWLTWRCLNRLRTGAPNGYSLRVVDVPQSRGAVQIVSTLSCLSGGPGRQFFWGSQSCDPAAGPKPTLKPFYTHSLNTLIHQSNPLNPPYPHSPQPTHRLIHPHLSNPLGKIHPHITEHLFNCTHLYTSSNILDLWMSPGRVVPLLATWKGRLAGLPLLLVLSDPSTATRRRGGSTTTTPHWKHLQ